MMPQSKPATQALLASSSPKGAAVNGDGLPRYDRGLRDARELFRLDRRAQKRIAKRMRVSQAVVSHILSGKRRSERVRQAIEREAVRIRERLKATLNGSGK
ncbi:MAG TPA: hypothetical protein VGR84_19115 [Candidatus Acidoferrales bacterium]|nr:hypothetical protein [Candidatus Acidoferrales bacterium]